MGKMQESDRAEGPYLRRERVSVAVFVLVVSLTTAHFLHEAWHNSIWLATWAAAQAASHSTGAASPAKLYAPVAYRIAMPTLTGWVLSALPSMDEAKIRSGLDFVFLVPALWVVSLIAVKDMPLDRRVRASRGIRLALTFLFCTAALVWAPQYQRPETMPAALYLALSLLLVGEEGVLATALMAVLAVLQGFVRADVAFCFGLATLGASFLVRGGPADRGSDRALLQLRGVMVTLLGGGVQAYLQFVRFPHLTYDPQTPVIQLRTNLYMHMWSNALLAVAAEWAAVLFGLHVAPGLLRSSRNAVAFLMGALYLAFWLTVGLGGEVRIYVPVLLMMSPFAAAALARGLGWAVDDEQIGAAPETTDVGVVERV